MLQTETLCKLPLLKLTRSRFSFEIFHEVFSQDYLPKKKKKKAPKVEICFQNVSGGDDSTEIAITGMGQDRR